MNLKKLAVFFFQRPFKQQLHPVGRVNGNHLVYQVGRNPDNQLVLRLITSYQTLMDKRLHSFDTLLHFSSDAVIIQFVFLVVTTNRARTAGDKLKDSEEVLKLLNLARDEELRICGR